jgi:hypothetical protein
MNEYLPDNWVIIKIKGDDPHYKTLSGWSGGYTQGSSWRMNSGITNVEEDSDAFRFKSATGSWTVCRKGAYGLRMNNAHVWAKLQEIHGDKVELMPEDTDWNKMDWIIK